jgi:hypothetical protein
MPLYAEEEVNTDDFFVDEKTSGIFSNKKQKKRTPSNLQQ